MKRFVAGIGITVGAVLAAASQAAANEPSGGPPDYSGITGMYYVLIGIVLAYGVYDTFLKKS